MDAHTLARFIDHTLLQPAATRAQIDELVAESLKYEFRSVCVESKWLSVVVPRLVGSKVLPITVVSFPQGVAPTDEKIRQTKEAVALGAKEIDMVLNREWLALREYEKVLMDIRAVVEAAGVPVKVILETSELSVEQKAIACALSKMARATLVKTSTGFSKSGANHADIRLMRSVVGPTLGVKASGGIRTLKDALVMIESGADRLGLSASVSIIRELSCGEESAMPGGTY